MKKTVILISLVILVAGCIGGQQPARVDQNNGLVINSFVATPSQLFSDDAGGVLFELEAENVGGTDAKNVKIDILGVEGQWRDSQGNVLTSSLTKDVGTMRAPVPERNIPGKVIDETFNIRPPELRQGISPLVGLDARVTYDYSTSGYIDVVLISDQQFQQLRITKQPLPTPVTVVNSAGPIHMTVSPRYAAPVVVDTSLSDPQTQTIRIELTNVGSGFPITEEDQTIGAGGRIIGTIDLLGPNGVQFSDCLNEGGGTSIDLNNVDLRIRETNSVPISCTISIDPNVLSQAKPMDHVKLIFDLQYTYFVSASQKVQVIGRSP